MQTGLKRLKTDCFSFIIWHNPTFYRIVVQNKVILLSHYTHLNDNLCYDVTDVWLNFSVGQKSLPLIYRANITTL
jgi:hypothetical protein